MDDLTTKTRVNIRCGLIGGGLLAVAVLAAPIAAAEDGSPRVLPEDGGTTNIVFADPVDDALVEDIRVYLEEIGHLPLRHP